MNKTIILALILTTLSQLFCKIVGVYYQYDDEEYKSGEFKTIYTPQEDYEAAVKTLENGDDVYIDNKGKDNGEDNLWYAYAYIIANNTK